MDLITTASDYSITRYFLVKCKISQNQRECIRMLAVRSIKIGIRGMLG